VVATGQSVATTPDLCPAPSRYDPDDVAAETTEGDQQLGPDIPALIGLLIDLSRVYIATVSVGFVRAPGSWNVVPRSSDKPDHLCRLTAVQCSIRWA
jgi:hypothetical protein